MDLVKTLLLYLMMIVSTATGVSPDVTPIPADMVATPAPYVTATMDPALNRTPAPTAVPTKARYDTLMLDNQGTNVRRLQRRLAELGYLDSKDVDGVYGLKTKKAVEQFQRKNGLRVDGIAGVQTQQIMFESPSVVFYNNATATPVPTQTPVPYVSVPIYYRDAVTNAVLATTTANCFNNSYIQADNGRVPAGYTLVSNSPVLVTVRDGVATPSSVTFRYQAPVTAVNIPVLYVDEYNMTIAREDVRLIQSAYVFADTSKLPAGYVFVSETSKYVTVVNGIASESQIVFRVARSATAAPAAAAVTVQYIDQMTGRLLYEAQTSLSVSGRVYANDGYVPYGYTRTSAQSVSVSVVSGQANPQVVQFFYRNPAVTATPAPSVYVPIYYIDAQTNHILASDGTNLTASKRVYRNTAKIPEGYAIVGDYYKDVTVANGAANPASIVFKVGKLATPTPVPPAYVDVEVRYRYGSTTINSSIVPCLVGQTSYIYADSRYYAPEYQLSSTAVNPKTVKVSADGSAVPSVVTFYLSKAVPTQAPTAVPPTYVDVQVRYRYGSSNIYTTTVACRTGQTRYIYADSSVYSPAYVLSSSTQNPQVVTVSADGTASPSIVTFYLTKAAPTAVPRVNVLVQYIYGSRVIAEETVACEVGRTTTVRANAQIYGSQYVVSGKPAENVFVSRTGEPNPSVVTFYLARKATATPTSVPKYKVKVPVKYVLEGRVIISGEWECMTGETTTIYAQEELYGRDYVLTGRNTYDVTVSYQGVPSPSEVVFGLARRATATPEPKYGVQVPVRYVCDGRIIVDGVWECMTGETTTVYAQEELYGRDYVLTGKSTVDVKVNSRGVATPSEVTFTLRRRATATPEPKYGVQVPVRYVCDGRIIVDGVWECMTGETTTVYAQEELYGRDYVLTGKSTVDVKVNSRGVATPSEVTFTLKRRATATPEPKYGVQVPVRYVCDGRIIVDGVWECMTGETTTVYAQEELYGRDYVLTGRNTYDVTVSSRGVATPSEVTFTLKRRATPTPKPTEVPVVSVEVPVEYVCGSEVIHEYTQICYSDRDNIVYADESVYGRVYVLKSQKQQTVRVSLSGVASPSVVVFYLELAATPKPTEVPSFRVDIPVQYICNGRVVYRDTVPCSNDTTVDVTPNYSLFSDMYELDSPMSVRVRVDVNGNPDPSPVIFYLNEIRQEPDPEPEPYYPDDPAPGGNTNTSLPKPLRSVLDKQKIPVYQGPGKDYYQAPSDISTYTGQDMDVYGVDGNWLLVCYPYGNGRHRIGYLEYTQTVQVILIMHKLKVPTVNYEWIQTTVTGNARVYDDPESDANPLETLPAGTSVTFLAKLTSGSSRLALIEYVSPNSGRKVRALVECRYLRCMQ